MMKTVGEILQLSTSFLTAKGVERPRRVAEELLAYGLGRKRLDLYLAFDQPLNEDELSLFRPLLKRAAQHEPLQYILGIVDFHRISVRVTPDVLIPRPETEEMVEHIVAEIGTRVGDGCRFLDLCAGSGCIGIAMKKAYPSLHVTLADCSAAALAVAQENAVRNQVEVTCVQGDLLKNFSGERFHFVACNPPYVSEKEFVTLAPSVRDFEPKVALVAEEEGTALYRRLSGELVPFLYPSAQVFLEIGAAQKGVMNFFTPPSWRTIRPLLDRSGKNRFIFLEKE